MKLMDEKITDADKRWATLTHLATIPAPFIAPIVSLAIFRKSRYVCAHALQALYEHLFLKIFLALALVCSFTYSLTRLWHHYQTDWKEFSWTEFLIRFVVGFLILALLELINAIQAVYAASKANKGVWPKNGRIVRGILGKMHRPLPETTELTS
jgi:hypothetical protein